MLPTRKSTVDLSIWSSRSVRSVNIFATLGDSDVTETRVLYGIQIQHFAFTVYKITTTRWQWRSYNRIIMRICCIIYWEYIYFLSESFHYHHHHHICRHTSAAGLLPHRPQLASVGNGLHPPNTLILRS